MSCKFENALFTTHRELFRDYVDHQTVKVIGDYGTGSGFFLKIKEKFYVMTNKHVCETSQSDNISLLDYDTKEKYQARIIDKSKLYDLCVIEPSYVPEAVKNNELKVANNIEIGEIIHTFGYPYGRNGVFSSGEVVSKETIKFYSETNAEGECKEGQTKGSLMTFFGLMEVCQEEHDSYDTTLPVNPGSSGSAVFNNFGKIVGVVFAKDSRASDSGYIIPLSHLKDYIETVSSKI